MFEDIYSLAKKNIQDENYKQAKDNLLKCLNFKPSFDILHLLGVVYLNLKEYEKSIDIFKNLLKKKIVSDSIHLNLGIAFKKKKEYLKAKEQFELSVKLNPSNYLSFFNLGNVFVESKRKEEAKKKFKRCLKIKKNYVPALINLSAIYLNQKEFKKSYNLLIRCVELGDESSVVLENLSKIFLLTKNFKQAEIYIKKLIKKSPNLLDKIVPVALGYTYLGKSEEYKDICKFYNGKLKLLKGPYSFGFNKSNKILKLGFVGQDFRNHPIGFFLKDMIPELSKKIDINVFSTIDYQDEISEFIEKYSNWIRCHKLSDDFLAELIYKKKIDILVDTSGMTITNKLNIFKIKPVKTQISWAGWLASTHMKEIDYIVGDHFATPSIDDKNFSEKVYRVRDIWCTYSRSVFDDLRLKKNQNNIEDVNFGCFQRPEKINQKVLKVWSKILLRTKRSNIYFINKTIGPYEKKIITDFFKKNKVSLSRVFFISPQNREIYLNSFNLVDINLDTFPYNGGTTSFESTFMNIPTLTMKNNSFMFRCGESINKNLNMDNWIADDEKDYIDKGVFFCNKKKLNDIKRKLNNQNPHCVLFDSKKFSNEFLEMILKIA